jgi:hypothetical protein
MQTSQNLLKSISYQIQACLILRESIFKPQIDLRHVIFITNAHFVKNFCSKWKKGLRYAYPEQTSGLTHPKLDVVWANLRKSFRERIPNL